MLIQAITFPLSEGLAVLIQDILETKGNAICTIGPEATLAEVAKTLVKHKIGSLLICQDDAQGERELLGIVTERDLLYQFAEEPDQSAHVPVSEIMSKNLITASREDRVEQILGIITAKRIRHLPVLENGRLIGIVSIGDLVKAQHDRLAMENRFMKDYIES
jgi:CBS domain-containing protein